VVHDDAMLRDFTNNPDPSLDLGMDGSFGDFRVLFYGCYDSATYGQNTLKPALEKKGFSSDVAHESRGFSS